MTNAQLLYLRVYPTVPLAGRGGRSSCCDTTTQDFAGCLSGRGQMQADDGDPVKVLSLGPRSQCTRSRSRSGRPGMQSIRAGSDHLEGSPSSGRARSAPRRWDRMERGHPGVGEAMLSPVEQTSASRGKRSYQGVSHQEITD